MVILPESTKSIVLPNLKKEKKSSAEEVESMMTTWKNRKNEMNREIFLKEKEKRIKEQEERENKRKNGEIAWMKWNEEKERKRKQRLLEIQARDEEMIKNAQQVLEERSKSMLPLKKKLNEQWNKKIQERNEIKRLGMYHLRRKLEQVKSSPYIGSHHHISVIQDELLKSKSIKKKEEKKQEEEKKDQDIYSSDDDYSEYSHEKKLNNQHDNDGYSNDDGFEDLSDEELPSNKKTKVIIESGTFDWGNISNLPIEPVPIINDEYSKDEFEEEGSPTTSPIVKVVAPERIQTAVAGNRGEIKGKEKIKINQDEDVHLALEKIKSLDPLVWKKILTIKNPSRDVCHIFGALCIIVGKEATWKNALKLIQGKDFIDILTQKSSSVLEELILNSIGRFILESFPQENLLNLGQGELAIYRWIRALQAFALETNHDSIRNEKIKKIIGPQMHDPELTCIFGESESESKSNDGSDSECYD